MKILIFVFIIFSQIAFADNSESEEHFEWGGGLLGVLGNHYRGSDQGKFWFFPLPYFSYSSKKLEAEPSFVRGIIHDSEHFAFKISLVPGLNVQSEKNKARAGMPSLDYTIEVGPMFIFKLWQSDNRNLAIHFEWPIRESFATDLSFLKPVGFFTVPYINILYSPAESSYRWRSELSFSPMFADQKYHQYFYGVDNQFIGSDRPFYKASGGYSGFQTAWVVNVRLKHFAILNFFRWDYLDKAIFDNSPLVKTKNYFIGGLGVFWMVD